MLLVYTHEITPRLKYIFKQICTRILGMPVSFTTVIEEFIAHDNLKMSYTKQPLSNEIFIRSHELLFEQGLSGIDISVTTWEDTKCFFPNAEKSALPFDIFAASFYLLSRFEEYLPHVKDEFGRFMAEESLAYKHDFLHQPVVDIWAKKFKKLLVAKYPNFEFTNRKYSIKPIIDVPTAYLYKHKGILRTIGGSLKDIYTLKFRELYTRFSVLFGLQKDPYNTYKYILNKQKQTKFKFLFFFLLADYSTYDKNINFQKRKFRVLIKHIADYCKIGLKASFYAIDDLATLKMEKDRMEAVTNLTLQAIRLSFSKVNLPESYRNMVELEIPEDYTMGYINHMGFRAGTCTPFLFYDLDYEEQTPLKINAYNVLDYSLLKINSLLDKQQALAKIIREVQKVEGEFIPVFHNYTFSNTEPWSHFKALFNSILDSTNEK